jgi:phthiocerol/phenolphthiocerol synthesis type-I polyketide synthase E
MSEPREEEGLSDVAVIGLAGRFPGADGVEQLWENLKQGRESLSFFTAEELEAAGFPRALRDSPGFVASRGVLRDPDLFDAPFFGFSPREARVLDPQQRVFLECAWEALENAGCDPGRLEGAVGVYAGASQSTYLLRNLLSNPEITAQVSGLEIKLGNEKDFLAPVTSYRLNLRGPSVNVATACSTSLVAVHFACQGLLNRECDVALAGGVSISFPQAVGYVFQQGGILSADGHCRTFDAGATGSVGGDGVGIVVLKRLEDALRDGDVIRAVIKASAINNDGSMKIGFTAPSVDGQAAVITEAQSLAGIDPATITYVEAHGSGTPLGDPVEIRALTRAFRAGTEKTGFCAVGSVKTNLGHLDAAAGVTGLIKTVLALEHGLIPPSLHFTRPNPDIPFAETPFFVAARMTDWKTADGTPRRAGVNSFGMGGTNAHVVLEEAPERKPAAPSPRPWQLLVLSAAAPAALESLTDRLAVHLKAHPEQELADVAFTGQVGRRPLRHRRVLVCRDRQDAIAALSGRDPKRLLTSDHSAEGRRVAFLLPGVGDHYAGMGKGLYTTEKVFRREVDRCAEILRPLLGEDPRDLLLAEGQTPEQTDPLDLRRMLGRAGNAPADAAADRTALLQPAVFLLEMALARLWRSWGVKPAALLGYSLGEYAAACLAGVFSLEDGLRLVAERARLLNALPAGAMLAVPLTEEELSALPLDGLSLAAVNAPGVCVLSGAPEAVAALEERLSGEGISARRLPTTHAFHSRSLEPVAGDFARLLDGMTLRPPQIPYVTGVSGDWVTAEQATDPRHWVRHLLGTVRFADGLRALAAEPSLALLEVGPGHGLTTLALQHGSGGADRVAVPSLRPVYDAAPDEAFLLGTLGRLWLAGVEIDWAGFHAGARRRKAVLPSYPFQRQRYWVEPGVPAAAVAFAADPLRAAPGAEASPPPVHGRPGLRNEYVAPRNPVETDIAAIWEDVLELRPVGLHDSFFELGGHSLLAPRVLARVRQTLGVDLPITLLLAAPTVGDLAAAVVARRGGADTAEETPIDLRAEAVLDPAICREATDGEGASLSLDVLLTGGTGFLGAYLLRDLLETGAVVHCLVRAASAEDGRRRLLRNLADHDLEVSDRAERIVVVPGDLAAPRWGMEEEAFRALADRVGAVYHCGAWVNFTYPYQALAPANVRGTEEVLRLAALGARKVVHFISSVAVFAPGSFTPEGLGMEDSDLPATEGLSNGYAQTKWVAEKLVEQARERGIPAIVYRPGLIGGDTRTGINNPRDLMWSFLKGCLQMEAAPDLELPFDPAPVDFVSRAIVWLSRQPESAGRAFHFFNPRPLPWREVFAFARSLGYPLRLMPVAEWDQHLFAAVEQASGRPEENALSPFRSLLDGERTPDASGASSPRSPRSLRLDGRNTWKGLAGSGIECPPIDHHLLGLYFESLTRGGFLAAPREREEAIR